MRCKTLNPLSSNLSVSLTLNFWIYQLLIFRDKPFYDSILFWAHNKSRCIQLVGSGKAIGWGACLLFSARILLSLNALSVRGNACSFYIESLALVLNLRWGNLIFDSSTCYAQLTSWNILQLMHNHFRCGEHHSWSMQQHDRNPTTDWLS